MTSKYSAVVCGAILLALASPMLAQTGDWSLVEQIKPGARVSIQARHGTVCIFENATDEELFCRLESPRYFNFPPEISYDRRDVREVRMEHSDDFHSAVGAGVGFAVGAAVGATHTPSSRGTVTLIYGAFGALIGQHLGPSVALIHGPVIYHR